MNDSQRAYMRTHGTLVGRVLLGLLFLVSGLQMLTAGVSGSYLLSAIEGVGIPLAGFFAWVIILVKVLGGSSLIVGYRVGLAAASLFVFTLLTIVFVHNNLGELTAALKNLSIMGGLLYVMAYGAGEGWKISR